MLWMFGAALAGSLPDLDSPLKTGARTPEDAAVVVGLEDYYELPDVPYAERDAQAFADFLLYTRGIPSERIERVPKANREKLLSAVQAAATRAGSAGTVWVYFAGHGAASPETGERVLMGIDVQPDLQTFTARSVGVDEIRTAATAAGSRAVLVLDTCYTGQGRSGVQLLPGKRFAVPTFASSGSARVVEWSAASANQFSGPLQSTRHGAFTWAVLGALRGWADGQLDDVRDGQVTAEEARLYVEGALRSLQVRDQVPVLVTQGASDWVLASHPKAEAAPSLDGAPPVADTGTEPEPRAAPTPPPQPRVSTGMASVCFKRSRSLAGAAVAMDVASGDRVLVSVRLGGAECTEVEAGEHQLQTWFKSMKRVRGDVVVQLGAGEEAWFLLGANTGLVTNRPTIGQVTRAQYDDGDFDLVR